MEKWRVLFLNGSMAIIIWMSRWMFAVEAPAIKLDLNLTYTQVGIPPTAAVLFAAVGYGLSGFLTYRIGTKKTLFMATLATLVGTFGTFVASSFDSLVIFQSVIGLSEGIFYVAALVLVTNTFGTGIVGRALGMLEAGVNIGIVLSILSGTFISTMFGWRYAYLMLGLLGVIVTCYVMISPATTIRKYQSTNLRKLMTDPFMIAVSTCIVLFFFVNWSFSTFAVIYLTDSVRVPYAISGVIVALSYGVAILGSIIGGAFTDRIGTKKTAQLLLLIGAASLGIFSLSVVIFVTVASLLLVAVTQGALVSVLLTFVPKRFPQFELGRTYGITILVAYGGAGIWPLIVGHLADSYGFATAFLLLTGLLVACGIVVTCRL